MKNLIIILTLLLSLSNYAQVGTYQSTFSHEDRLTGREKVVFNVELILYSDHTFTCIYFEDNGMEDERYEINTEGSGTWTLTYDVISFFNGNGNQTINFNGTMARHHTNKVVFLKSPKMFPEWDVGEINKIK